MFRARQLPVVVLTVWGIASLAGAQRPVDDGRALDANNRVGGGRYNDPVSAQPPVSGNQIVTGNVTGLGSFKGFVPYRDPRAFTGPYAGQSTEAFLRSSAGPAQPYRLPTNPNQAAPFYGYSLATPAPAGFNPVGNTGTYVWTPPAPLPGTTPQDLRTNLAIPPVSYGPPSAAPAMSDWRVNPSPSWSTSPLQPLRPQDALENQDRRLSDDRAASDPAARAGAQPLSNDLAVGRLSDALPSPTVSSAIGTVAAAEPQPPAPAAQTSTQYAQLRERFTQYLEERLKADPEGFRQILHRLGGQPTQTPQPGPTPTTRPRWATYKVSELAQISRELAIRSAAMDQPPTTRPAPVEVKSLATGVNVSVVAAMLNKAEALMRSGKYASALDQYAAAEAASPSNPLVWLGRAHGELGAGYYNRAELHLRQALTADPTLLMGRYDLRQMMGEERITYLVGDLKQLAMQDARSATPLILLSYIAYNVGRENEAGLWLKTASERLPKADLLVRILREHWRVSP